MNTSPSPVQLIFSLIDELTYLNAQPRRGVEPRVYTLEVLSDEIRMRVNGVLVEAKMVLDSSMGRGNQLSSALAMLAAKSHPMPLEVQDLLQRALKYINVSKPSLTSASEAALGTLAADRTPSAAIPAVSPRDNYVHADRLTELRQLRSEQWDLRRLIRLCEELNIAHHNDCTMSVAMLVRAIKDHCPPVFGYEDFAQVANNAPGVSQSRRAQLKRLSTSLKDIADSFLHEHIRARETLPTPTQTAFSPDLDGLLGEIIVAVKRQA